MSRIRNLCRLSRCTSGAAAIEFALIGMVAITLLLATFEFGRALFVYNQLTFAADVASRQILINPAVADGQLESAIRNALSFDHTQLQLELSQLSVDGMPFRTISVRQPLTLLVPDLYDKNIMLSVDRRVPLL